MNAQLAQYLKEASKLRSRQTRPNETAYPRHRRWKIRDRLKRQDIADIVRAFKAGTPKHILATRYNMNLRSLKKLLREEGVKRRSK